MRKTIFFMVMLMVVSCIKLAAQEVTSVESNISMIEDEQLDGHKFDDKVLEQVSMGGAKPVIRSGGTRTRNDDRGHMGTASFILNRGVKYRVSTGVLSEKNGMVEFMFYFNDNGDKKTLKSIRNMIPGRIYSFDFECEKTGKYGNIHEVGDIGKASSAVAIAEIVQN